MMQLAIVALIALIVYLIWKIVYTPAVVVTTDANEYPRNAPVTITGTLLRSTGEPIAGQAVGIAIEPPTGDAYNVGTVTTQADGTFTSPWTVPADAVLGAYILTASAMGVSNTATFTQIRV